jgi:hypothetical protein
VSAYPGAAPPYHVLSGGGRTKVVKTAKISSGDVTATSAAFVQIGTDLVIPAIAGDILKLKPEAICSGASAADMGFDAATRVSAADHNWWSTSANTAAWPGVLAPWYVPGGAYLSPATAEYTVQADDIVNGSVTVRLYARSSGADRLVLANANYKTQLWLENIGQG